MRFVFAMLHIQTLLTTSKASGCRIYQWRFKPCLLYDVSLPPSGMRPGWPALHKNGQAVWAGERHRSSLARQYAITVWDLRPSSACSAS